MSTRFLYDTAVFLYATGAEHAYRAPCREILRLAAAGTLLGEASIELIQEYVHVRARRSGDRSEAVRGGRYVSQLCRVHALEPDDLSLGLALFEQSPGLHMRDALHAATALNRDIHLVLSPDHAFEQVANLERIDPADALDLLLRAG